MLEQCICIYRLQLHNYKQHLEVKYYGGTYSPHPLLGDPCFLHRPQCVHEPAPVAGVLWWRLSDVEQHRAVSAGRQTQHFYQTANCLVAYSAAIPR